MLKNPKVLGPLILISVIGNFVFLHTLWRTMISYLGFFGYSLLFSIPLMFLIFWASRKWESVAFNGRLFLSLIGGYFIYLLCFSILPFGLNFYFAEAEGKSVSTHDYQQTSYTSVDDNTAEKTTHINYAWKYDGFNFNLNLTPEVMSGSLQFKVHQGALGFGVIKDVEVK